LNVWLTGTRIGSGQHNSLKRRTFCGRIHYMTRGNLVSKAVAGARRPQAELHGLSERVRLSRHSHLRRLVRSIQPINSSESGGASAELMIQRQCPHCNSELVRARRTDQQSVPGIAPAASPGWRCNVCGHEFTTEQIRDSKRTKGATASAASR
jgi:predicted Zn-ribbon and HTH transcriptional regulator